MSNIRVFKLLTGEEIIAEICMDVTAAEDQICLKNVIRFLPTAEGLVMNSYLMLSQQMDFTLKLDHIVTMGEPTKEILDGYNSSFGNIMTPPEKKLII